ncbi:S8 family serine peptidase, partial [Acidobacteria bacterium AH-259-A15]|nr:S8 family serine peptidase [Acidobacteria bacterium AH-259-A15]
MTSARKRRKTWVNFSVLLAVALLVFFPSFARLSQSGSPDPLVRFAAKLSPVLREEVAFLASNPQFDYGVPIIVKVNSDFFAQNADLHGHESSQISTKILRLIGGYTARLTGAQIKLLLSSEVVEYVTLDIPVRATSDASGGDDNGHPSPFLAAIGANQVHAAGYTGKGVTVAVFDSGIASHPDLDASRILAAVDFTSGTAILSPSSSDNYGHGTAVAGIIGGTGRKSDGAYAGVAPGAKFVDLKVVGEDGTGLTSNLIKAIEWAIENKDVYGIRIANLSLGHPPVESYKTDPLCQAVEQLVAAGIVTVASAGNLGKTSNYPKIWGAINSPANDPAVIAVYPVNTHGSATHTDDIATTYGSRGPSYLDNLFKPDLSAPGNRIPTLLAEGSRIHLDHAELQIDHYYINLSGASAATPFVAGTVALMLEANPDLNPNMIKLTLLFTAIKLEQLHILEQGNGLVNALTAVRLSEAIDMEKRRLTDVVPRKWFLDGEEV